MGAGTSDADVKLQRELQEFDALAHAALNHIGQYHAREANEVVAVAHLASKVYAVRLLQSSDQQLVLLRAIWAETIRAALFVLPPPIQADAAAPSSSDSSAAEPSGSYENKSSRNFSN
jgi:hypothetical protein